MDVVLRIIALLALILGNAFFVMCEYCIVTARRVALQARADAGSHGARAALRLLDDAFRVVTYLAVVLGELVPKALTLAKAETIAVLLSRPIEFMAAVLRPVAWVL